MLRDQPCQSLAALSPQGGLVHARRSGQCGGLRLVGDIWQRAAESAVESSGGGAGCAVGMRCDGRPKGVEIRERILYHRPGENWSSVLRGSAQRGTRLACLITCLRVR
jgi:hypothetical protein